MFAENLVATEAAAMMMTVTASSSSIFRSSTFLSRLLTLQSPRRSQLQRFVLSPFSPRSCSSTILWTPFQSIYLLFFLLSLLLWLTGREKERYLLFLHHVFTRNKFWCTSATSKCIHNIRKEVAERVVWRVAMTTTSTLLHGSIKITMIDKVLTAFSIACVYRIGLDSSFSLSIYLSIFICTLYCQARAERCFRIVFSRRRRIAHHE